MEKIYVIKNFINFNPHLVLSGVCDGWSICRAWRGTGNGCKVLGWCTAMKDSV